MVVQFSTVLVPFLYCIIKKNSFFFFLKIFFHLNDQWDGLNEWEVSFDWLPSVVLYIAACLFSSPFHIGSNGVKGDISWDVILLLHVEVCFVPTCVVVGVLLVISAFGVVKETFISHFFDHTYVLCHQT